MATRTRRHLIAGLLILILAVVIVLVFALRPDLKSRLAVLSIGMHRKQVEDKLGPPQLTLERTGGRGNLMVWTDQFWQLDVTTGPDGQVESIGCKPSDSMFRRTVASFNSLFK